MGSRMLFLAAALALLQLCLAQHHQFYQWSSPFEHLSFHDRRRQLPPPGYHPEFGTCGSGTTCEGACGPNWLGCKASTDLSLFCYNKVDLGQTCCENGSGRACDRGYYCAWNTFGGKVWCCKDGQSREECGVTPEPDNSTPHTGSGTTVTTTTTATTTDLRVTTTTTTTTKAIDATTVTTTVSGPQPGGKTVTVTVVQKETVTTYCTVSVTVTVGQPCPTPPSPPQPTSSPCTDVPSSGHPQGPGYTHHPHGTKLSATDASHTVMYASSLTSAPSAVVTAGASHVGVSSLAALVLCIAGMLFL